MFEVELLEEHVFDGGSVLVEDGVEEEPADEAALAHLGTPEHHEADPLLIGLVQGHRAGHGGGAGLEGATQTHSQHR